MIKKLPHDLKHRRFVGRHVNWDEMGDLQLSFLQKMGLEPHHKFLDVGCGSLRGGRKLIKYLDSGNYYGMDHHKWLVDAGLKYEVEDPKDSHFTINDEFDFSEFKGIRFDIIWMSSLVIHLTPAKIEQCLNNVRDYIKDDGVLYLSMIVGNSKNNLPISSDKKCFRYTIDEFKQFVKGWNIEHSEEIHQIYKSDVPWRQNTTRTILKLTKK